MPDSIVLLEERKEVTTFLLDEGTITATTVTTPTGETPGYEYSGDKIKVDDAVTLSANSDIGKPTVKKYTAAEGEALQLIAGKSPTLASLPSLSLTAIYKSTESPIVSVAEPVACVLKTSFDLLSVLASESARITPNE